MTIELQQHVERLAQDVRIPPFAVITNRASRKRQRRVAALAATVALLGALAVADLGAGGSRAILVPANPSSAATPTPVPGSTPAYTPLTGRDWFLSKAEGEAFYAGYQQPSPRPGDSVPSPHATGPLTDRLVDEMKAAGVPGTESLTRDEAESGHRGSIQVQGSLPDGRGLYVGRRTMDAPLSINNIGSADSERLTTVEDVPGTDAALLLLRADPASPAPRYTSAFLATPSGQLTVWSSDTVSLAELKAWAVAAYRWSLEH